ncbi:MAG: hypothetical protein JWR25_762 [Noviherbaspirillum sp.]|nr:hypothetical protein [Noviherbaspirillum sp.]
MQADWRRIGLSDGVNGLGATRINDHAEACSKHGVPPDLNAYLSGRTQGFLTYCQPANGFSLGRRGAPANAAECAVELRPGFAEQHRRGSEIHAIESDLRHREASLHDNDRQIRRNEARIARIRGELARKDLPADRRTALLNEYEQLVHESHILGRQNDFLRSQARHLYFHLQTRLRDFGF